MPNGNLNVVRNSDGKIIASAVKTVKSAKIAAANHIIEEAIKNGTKGTVTETFSVCVPKESFSISIDTSAISTDEDTLEQATKIVKADFVA